MTASHALRGRFPRITSCDSSGIMNENEKLFVRKLYNSLNEKWTKVWHLHTLVENPWWNLHKSLGFANLLECIPPKREMPFLVSVAKVLRSNFNRSTHLKPTKGHLKSILNHIYGSIYWKHVVKYMKIMWKPSIQSLDSKRSIQTSLRPLKSRIAFKPTLCELCIANIAKPCGRCKQYTAVY